MLDGTYGKNQLLLARYPGDSPLPVDAQLLWKMFLFLSSSLNVFSFTHLY